MPVFKDGISNIKSRCIAFHRDEKLKKAVKGINDLKVRFSKPSAKQDRTAANNKKVLIIGG